MLNGLLARGIMKVVQARAAARFEAQAKRPARTQRQVLARILRENRDTEVGRRHGFASIGDPREYARRVPVVTAEEMAPAVARMAAGEQNVLTAQRPGYYCQTGGTTGAPKLSPVTRAYTREYQSTIPAWLHHVRADCPALFGGKALYFVGTAEAGRTPDGTPYGTMTGYNFRALPSFVRSLYALPYELSMVDDYDAKYYAALRLALPQDVRFLISVTPSTLLLLGRKLALYDEELIEDIEAGILSARLPLSPAVRAALERGLGADPACAARLRELRRCTGRPLRPVDAWPNLGRLACWKSGPSAPYIPQLAPFYGDTPVRDAIYSATEAWMNIPMSDAEPGGALAVGSHFFEFFPEEDTERAGDALLARDLEEGRRYAIIITASSGMYRYDIKDIVQCVGRHHHTPVIAFSHKEGGFCSLVGEKLSDNHVSAAAAGAAKEAGVDLCYFSLCPDQTVPPRYIVRAEFSAPPAGGKARRFLAALERGLGEQAWEYRSHREAGDLAPPELCLLSQGSNDAVRRAFIAGGGNEAQMKPRHLLQREAELPAGLTEERRFALADGAS